MKFTREQRRGLYERRRRAKFLYLKHTNMLASYYKSIRRHNDKPTTKDKIITLNWWEKLVVFIKALFKTLKAGTAQ